MSNIPVPTFGTCNFLKGKIIYENCVKEKQFQKNKKNLLFLKQSVKKESVTYRFLYM